MNFPLNELNLLLIILLSAAAVLVSILAYKIRLLQKDYDRLLHENKEDSRILFLKSRYASMGETVGNIAHQWKQPLNAIGSIQNSIKAALVFKGEISKEKLLDSVETSFKLLRHLAETIDTFYSFLAQQGDDKTRFVVADELEKVRKITEYSFENSHITLNYELEINPTIQGNANEFTHAILNLILNAKDAFDGVSVDAPRITVHVSGGDETCHITVADNAGGVRLKPVDMVFDLHITTKEDGSGLGLFMTKNIIEKRFGGKITVKNVKGGACFTIELPYAEYGKHCADTVTPDERLTLDRINQLSRKIIELEEIEKVLKKWADIFEQAQWGIVMCGADTMTLDLMNPAFAQMHGFEVNELTKKPIESIFAPEYRDQVKCILHTVQQESHYAFESVHIRKDGSRFPVAIDITAVKDDNDNVLYRIANVRDITVYKEAEEKLLLKQFALDTIHEAVYLIDENSMFYYVNDGACKALGYAKEELLAMGVVDIDPNCSVGWWGIHWEDIKRHKTVLGQASHRKKDGSVFPIEVSSNYFEYNGVGYSLAVARDITERRLLEAEKENRIIKTVAENSPDVIIRYDTQGRRTYANPKARELFGVVLGKSPSEETPIIDKEYYVTQLHRVIDTGVEATFEITYTNAISAIDYSHIRMVPEFGDDGKISSVLMIGRDITELKQALHALEIKEQELRALAESSPGMMGSYYLRPDGSVCMPYTSPNIVDLFGVTPEEVADGITSLTKLHHPDDHDRILETIAESARDMSVWHQQYRILHPTKGIRWMESNTMPNPHPEGGIIWYGYVHDITERKAMEALLEQERRFLIDAQRVAHTGSWHLDIPNGVLTWSDETYSIFEIEKESVTDLRKTFYEYVHPEDRELVEAPYVESLITRLPYQVEHRIVMRDGRIKYVIERCEHTYDNNGTPLYSIGTVQDITERKAMEALLQEANDRYIQILDNSSDVIYLLDVTPEGRFVYVDVNAAYEEVTGIPRDVVIGLDVEDIEDETFRTILTDKFTSCLNAGEKTNYTADYPFPAGIRTFHSILLPIRDESGRIVRIVGAARDITERQEIEESLKKALEFNEGIIAAIPDLLFEIAPDGTYVGIWAQNEELLVAQRELLLGKNFKEFLPPEAVISMIQTMKEVDEKGFSVGKTFSLELDKGKKWFELSVTKKKSSGNYIVLSRDITERKKIEEQLQRSETSLKEAQKIAKMGSWELEISTQKLTWSDETYRLFEIDKEQGGELHTIFYDSVHPDDREMVKSTFEESLKTKQPFEIVHRIVMGDGRIKYVLESCETQYDAAGNPVLAIGAVQDITERKQAEDMIRELNTTLEERVRERTAQLQLVNTAVNSSTEAIYITDETLSILYVNDGACHMLGYTRDELTGMKVYDIDVLFSAEHIALIREHTLSAKHTLFETKHRTKGGRILDVEIAGSSFVFNGTEVEVSVVKDITFKKEVDKRLRLVETAMNHASEAVYIVGDDRSILYVSEGACRMLGYSVEELMGMKVYEIDAFMNKEEIDAVKEHVACADEFTFETKHRAKDGHAVDVEITVTAFEYEDVRLRLSIVKEISERKKIEALQQERLALEERLSKVAAAAPGVNYIFEKTAEGTVRFTYLAPGFEELFGLCTDAAMNDFALVMQLVHPDDRDAIRQSITVTAEELCDWREEFRVIHPLKGELWIEGQSSPELQPDGSIVWYGFFYDATKRKDAEEALAKSEETFRAMVENSPDVIIRYDLECRRTYINPIGQRLMGKPLEEIIGKTPGEYSPLPESAEFQKLFERVVSEGKEIELESPYRISEGEMRIGHQRIVPELNAEGSVVSVMVIGRDITERKKLEEKIHIREQYQRTLLDNFPYFVWLKDQESRLLAANLQYARVAKVESTADLEGKTDFDFFPRELAQKYVTDDKAVMNEAMPKNVEEQYANEHGEIHWMETWKSPVWVNGQIVGTVGCSRDITEQKKAEEELRSSEQRYKEIFENSSDMIYLLEVVDVDHYRYLAVNRAFENASGILRDLVIGRFAGENTISDTARIMNEEYRRCVTTKHVIESTAMLDIPSGRKCFRYTLIPVLNTGGDVYRIIALAKETTE